MKVKIDWDERYPDYAISTWGNVEVELSEAELADWKRVESEYSAWQAKFHKLRKGE